MTRRLVIEVTCDLCGNATAEETSELRQFAWGGKTYEFDSCDPCSPSVKTLSLNDIMDISRVPMNPAAQSAPEMGGHTIKCVYCGFIASSRSGLGRHAAAKHPQLARQDTSGFTSTVRCPHCSFIAASTQSLGKHKSLKHREIWLKEKENG